MGTLTVTGETIQNILICKGKENSWL